MGKKKPKNYRMHTVLTFRIKVSDKKILKISIAQPPLYNQSYIKLYSRYMTTTNNNDIYIKWPLSDTM